MPFGAGFSFALNHPSSIVAPGGIKLPQLRRLELDGFEDVQSLLELAPGLKALKMQLTGGYSPGAMVDLCVALREVRGLSELAVTPETLRLAGVDAPVGHAGTGQGTLLDVIGVTLPSLHKLDLRGYWNGDEVNYLSSRKYLQPEVRSPLIFSEVHALIYHPIGRHYYPRWDTSPHFVPSISQHPSCRKESISSCAMRLTSSRRLAQVWSAPSLQRYPAKQQSHSQAHPLHRARHSQALARGSNRKNLGQFHQTPYQSGVS